MLKKYLERNGENLMLKEYLERKGGICMRRWYIWAAVAVIAVLCVVLVAVWSRPVTVSAGNLMEGITPNEVALLEDLSESSAEVTDFGIRLFQAAMQEGENTLLSPLSVLCALAMTANGAEGETLAQMEKVLGLSAEELNSYIHTYMAQLPEGEKYKLRLANSIWFADKETFLVEQDFLQTNADYRRLWMKFPRMLSCIW